MKHKRLIMATVFVIASAILLVSSDDADALAVPDSGFEDGTFSGWTTAAPNGATQSGTFSGSEIGDNGAGINIVNGPVSYSSGVGQWVFTPFGNYAALLQPGNQTNLSVPFDTAATATGIASSDIQSLKNMLLSQAPSAFQGTPTNANWISRDVSLSAGTTYTMSWNYTSTDYEPWNDGSITTLVKLDDSGNPTESSGVVVNNQSQTYALLGFTNQGTGDYSTGSYSSTGWQISTYTVPSSGTYRISFMVFNLGDQAYSPVLLVDSQPGTTTKDGQDFGAVAPNNPDAPVATEPPATEPPATDPPVTDPPATDPPATDPPSTDPPTTDAPVETDPPVTEPPSTEPPVEETTATTRPRPRPRPTTTTTAVPEETTTTSTAPATDAPIQTDPPSTDNPSTPETLPTTGSDNNTTGFIAFIMIVGGYAALKYARKRSSTK